MSNGLFPPSPREPAGPHRLWEKVLTFTPVVLTVVGTVLAGVSSGEMSQAQYYRALAAQHESKAEGQWSFFAAKKERAAVFTAEVRSLPVIARAGRLDPGTLEALMKRFLARLNAFQARAEHFQELLDAHKGKLGSGESTLRDRAAALTRQTNRLVVHVQALLLRLDEECRRPAVVDAFAYLGTGRLPESREAAAEAAPTTASKQIEDARQAVLARRSEEEVAALLHGLSDDDLVQALAAADARAAAFEHAAQPVDDVLKRLDPLLIQPAHVAADLHLEVEKGADLVAQLPADAHEVIAAAEALTQAENNVVRTATELINLYNAAREDYVSRRNEREAADNQHAASLYAVRVARSSLISDTHRLRGQLFFFGMLGAQAGVAIASLALAARQKSLLWSLAALAGLGAMALSTWVFLSMRDI